MTPSAQSKRHPKNSRHCFGNRQESETSHPAISKASVQSRRLMRKACLKSQIVQRLSFTLGSSPLTCGRKRFAQRVRGADDVIKPGVSAANPGRRGRSRYRARESGRQPVSIRRARGVVRTNAEGVETSSPALRALARYAGNAVGDVTTPSGLRQNVSFFPRLAR